MKFQNNRDVISKSTACLVKAPPEENRVKMATSDKDAAHRNVIKFCFDLGMTPVETQKKLQLSEDHRHVSRSLVYKWHRRFEDGQTVWTENQEDHGKLMHRPWITLTTWSGATGDRPCAKLLKNWDWVKFLFIVYWTKIYLWTKYVRAGSPDF